jgi:hypothetical protein
MLHAHMHSKMSLLLFQNWLSYNTLEIYVYNKTTQHTVYCHHFSHCNHFSQLWEKSFKLCAILTQIILHIYMPCHLLRSKQLLPSKQHHMASDFLQTTTGIVNYTLLATNLSCGLKRSDLYFALYILHLHSTPRLKFGVCLLNPSWISQNLASLHGLVGLSGS